MTNAPALTGSQVKKAGKIIRAWVNAPPDSFDVPPGVAEAIALLRAFRATHERPLAKATMGLRSMVRTVGSQGPVSQRLKRTPSAIAKLGRFPNMQLSTMQDIAGCRAVVKSVDHVNQVFRRLEKTKRICDVSDYLASPAPSGYRGLHVIVKYADEAGSMRNVEVQLRTNVMHEWAVTVERVGGRLGYDLKGGVGPPELLDFFAVASEAMALVEAGKAVPKHVLGRWESAHEKVAPFLERGVKR